jgi:hypothetical protein
MVALLHCWGGMQLNDVHILRPQFDIVKRKGTKREPQQNRTSYLVFRT